MEWEFMGMIQVGDKVKVLYKVYEDENWSNAMDRYIDDGEVHIVTNDHGICHKGIHRMSLDYDYAFPIICLELVAKGAGNADYGISPAPRPRAARPRLDTSGFAEPVQASPRPIRSFTIPSYNWGSATVSTTSGGGSGDTLAVLYDETRI